MGPQRSIVEAFEIRAGMKVGLVNEPDDFDELLGTLPPGAELLHRASEPLDVLIYFSDSLDSIKTRLPYLARLVAGDAALWMVHPRDGLGGSPEEGTAAVVRVGTDSGLTPDGTTVVNERWMAVRFRRADL